jgi:HPt (histidine-containing phosphotransfer) domain-containing protein
MSGGNPELIAEMIDIFSSQVNEISFEMQKLLDEKEYELLGKLAHKAKTSVAIMGMNELSQDLKKLELQAQELINIETYQSFIDNFKLETEEAVKELLYFKKNLK